MTHTEAALLRAIASHPDEDTPRLVFADYLEEQGTPSGTARAEFIRLHVQAARIAAGEWNHKDHLHREELLRRIDQILCEWDFTWQKEMPDGFRALSGYRRGFVYRASANASAIEKSPEDPRLLMIEEVELTPDVSIPKLRELVMLPFFARLTSLNVRGNPTFGWPGVNALVAGNHKTLRKLVLSRLGIGDRGLRTLSESHNFPRLRYLDISVNGISTDALDAFRNSRFRSRLEHVIEWGNPSNA